MLQLPNNCRAGTMSVYPANWKTVKADIKAVWRVSYYFYDDDLKKKKKVVLKAGINTLPSASKRREMTLALIEEELRELRDKGFNPITKCYSVVSENEISEFTPVNEALQWALKNIKVQYSTRLGIALVIKNIGKAIRQLHYDRMEIGQVKRKHLKFILQNCESSNPRWTANLFNHYRKYLSMLYKELVDIDIIDTNPVQGIAKQLHLKKIRETLTKEQRVQINVHLYKNYYTFWRFMQIFFHSGTRITELLSLKAGEVDITNQRYKVIVKKGRKHSEQWRIIKTVALPFWTEVLQDALPGSYLFSKGLQPGEQKIRREQVSRRWRTHVKEQLNVTADFYALKHLHTTEVVEILGDIEAAKLNGHSSTAMVVSVYDVGRKDRENEKLRCLQNEFS